MIKQKLISK